MTRVNFTKKDARELRTMRTARGLSQYEVADALGWVRSKVKRLEKHEVRSVEEGDLAAVRDLLRGGQEGRFKADKGRFKADKGRPKPKLDYVTGMARVLEALHDARARGKGYLYCGGIRAATGYTGCQVRAFCKRLEANGDIVRNGVGRGMMYVLIGHSTKTPKREFSKTTVRTEQMHEFLRAATLDAVRPLIREQVTFPGWLLDILRNEELDDLSIREVWGSGDPGASDYEWEEFSDERVVG